METRIFVSYAREDHSPAQWIVRFLRAAGFDIWFDKDSLHAGQDWRRVIEQEIKRARLLLICISKNSVDKTGFVQKEMRLALEQAELRPDTQVYIIPVSLDGCPVPDALERWQVLDLREQGGPDKLLNAIGNATGEEARAPHDDHDALASAIKNYNSSASSPQSDHADLGEVAREILELIEKEPDPEQRGIVEILQEVQPGFTHFFPKIQYGGSPLGIKSRLFRQGIAELVSTEHLFPPELNPSTNTRTYEYRID